MKTSAKLTTYGLTLAIVFATGWAIGTAVGPLDTPAPAAGANPHNHAASPGANDRPLSTNGYRLDPNPGWPLTFRILGPSGTPTTRFTNPPRLTLITVDRTGRREQLNPTPTPDGTWHTAYTPAPGAYQLLADFTPESGPHTVLESTMQVAADAY